MLPDISDAAFDSSETLPAPIFLRRDRMIAPTRRRQVASLPQYLRANTRISHFAIILNKQHLISIQDLPSSEVKVGTVARGIFEDGILAAKKCMKALLQHQYRNSPGLPIARYYVTRVTIFYRLLNSNNILILFDSPQAAIAQGTSAR